MITNINEIQIKYDFDEGANTELCPLKYDMCKKKNIGFKVLTGTRIYMLRSCIV